MLQRKYVIGLINPLNTDSGRAVALPIFYNKENIMNYRMIQLTNKNIPAVAANALIPLGNVTRRVCPRTNCCQTFEVTTSGADTVNITEQGYYRVVYNISAIAAAAGLVTVSLNIGGNSVLTASATASAEGDTVNITIPFMIRAFGNCASVPVNLPLSVQIANTGVALTSASSDLLIERTYC